MSAAFDDGRAGVLRPFLVLGDAGASAFDRGPAPHEVGVRPYLLTAGRTYGTRDIALEALVQTTARGADQRASLRFELLAIVEHCEEPTSVVEVAAAVRVPIGVARVLVADLAERGIVHVHVAPANVDQDVSLIHRLIHGVRAL